MRDVSGGGDEPRPPGEAERQLIALVTGAPQPSAAAPRKPEVRRAEPPERPWRAIVRGSLMDLPRAEPAPLLAIPLSILAPVLPVLLVLADFWSAAGLSLAVLLVWFGLDDVPRIKGRWLERVERDWLRALPFPVRGYFRVLGESVEERRIRVRIRFRGTAPAREVLEGFLRRVHIPTTAGLTGGAGSTWTAESGLIWTLVIEDVSQTNVPSLSWMRSVIDFALLPLHEAYPLRGVEFAGVAEMRDSLPEPRGTNSSTIGRGGSHAGQEA